MRASCRADAPIKSYPSCCLQNIKKRKFEKHGVFWGWHRSGCDPNDAGTLPEFATDQDLPSPTVFSGCSAFSLWQCFTPASRFPFVDAFTFWCTRHQSCNKRSKCFPDSRRGQGEPKRHNWATVGMLVSPSLQEMVRDATCRLSLTTFISRPFDQDLQNKRSSV